jgi:hypothetical protein
MTERKKPPSVPPQLEILSLSADVAIATFGSVLFCHFRRETPPACLVTLRAAASRILASHERFVFFGVIELESTPPEQEARQGFTRFFAERAKQMACMTVTYRGEGFRGAMIRAIVSAIVTLGPASRGDYPRLVAKSLDEAAAFVEKHVPAAVRGGLIEAFEAFATRPSHSA